MVTTVPVHAPDRECSYCDNSRGVEPPHGPPAVVYQDDSLYVLMAPASLGKMPGHTLVCSKPHVGTVMDLTDEECSTLMRGVRDVARAVDEEFNPNGIYVQQHNGPAAWQTVPHVHFHVIPVMAYEDWPPTDWLDITPSEIRIEQAAALHSRLGWSHMPDRVRQQGASLRRLSATCQRPLMTSCDRSGGCQQNHEPDSGTNQQEQQAN